jgi:hypothetical protein
VQANADDRSRRKRLDGDALTRNSPRPAQLDGPDDGLTGGIADDSGALLVERDQEDLQMARVTPLYL